MRPCVKFSASILRLSFADRLAATMNGTYVYCEKVKKLRRAIQNKRRGMLSATILLLHDNARPHSAV